MKSFINLMAVVVCSFIISACVGSSNSNTATTTPGTPNTPSADIARKINMRSAIYQTFTSSTIFPAIYPDRIKRESKEPPAL